MWTALAHRLGSQNEKPRACKAAQEEKALAAMSDNRSLVPRMHMLIPGGCPLTSLTQKINKNI